MKKTLFILGISLLVLILSSTIVNAATKEELIEFLSKKHNIAKEVKQITDGQKVEIERFLNEKNITDEQADEIIAKVNEGIDIMNKAGTADIDKLKSSQKQQLTNLAEEVAKILNITMTINSSAKSVLVFDETGKQLTAVPYGDTSSLAKTGADYTIYIVASVLAIFAIATIILTNKKNVINE